MYLLDPYIKKKLTYGPAFKNQKISHENSGNIIPGPPESLFPAGTTG